MNKKNDVIVVGGFHEVIELCEICGKRIVGIIDDKTEDQYFGYKILGDDSRALDLYQDFGDVPLIITPDMPKTRKKLAVYYSEVGFGFCNLIHPGAHISRYAELGKGMIVQNGVLISTNVVVGDFVRINTFANIMHDSSVGEYTTIGPNAVILGRVKISESCYIGANSTILPERLIDHKAIVGAGAVVTKDVKENVTVIGVPAQEIKRVRI